MIFEFDPNKSASNKLKHGIDFEEARKLWADTRRVEIKARTVGENPYLLIAELDNEIWSAIYTIRRNAIRIISVRKSRKNEKEIYLSTGI
jgi:uncharacterized DUF497 family protein